MAKCVFINCLGVNNYFSSPSFYIFVTIHITNVHGIIGNFPV